MRTDREQLIEKASNAAESAYRSAPWGESAFDRVAAAVLAVFEEAHAPSTDEREALVEVIEDLAVEENQFDVLAAEGIADRVLAWMREQGFHRTVQGEKPGEHGGTIPLYGMLDVWMALYGTSTPDFDEFYAEHGYAESWAHLLAAVRERCAVQGDPTPEDPDLPNGHAPIEQLPPFLARRVQGEPSDAGVGWFEWFKMPENTTEIAYVHENGDVFDPARGWNPTEFTIAAAEGRVFRLVRAGVAPVLGEAESEAEAWRRYPSVDTRTMLYDEAYACEGKRDGFVEGAEWMRAALRAAAETASKEEI